MKQLLSLLVLSSLTLSVWSAPSAISPIVGNDIQPRPARLAIIIDDLGNSLSKGLDAIALPGNISFAIMPHRKFSQQLATRAGRLGKDVLLHAPMSTVTHRALGPGALDETLSEKDFKDKLRFAINSTPYILGVNNHMGSLLTTDAQAMTWVMEVLKNKGLFFVDSRTHNKSLAYETAKNLGVNSAARDIFLDHQQDIDYIHIQFKKALAVAQRYGSAIAIGHPHPTTLFYLQQVLPQLDNKHVTLYKISDLLNGKRQKRPAGVAQTSPATRPNLDSFIEKLTKNRPKKNH